MYNSSGKTQTRPWLHRIFRNFSGTFEQDESVFMLEKGWQGLRARYRDAKDQLKRDTKKKEEGRGRRNECGSR